MQFRCFRCGQDYVIRPIRSPPRRRRRHDPRNRAQGYAFETEATFPWSDVQSDAHSAHLEPGETHRSHHYRAVSKDDVIASAWRSLGTTIAAIVISAGGVIVLNFAANGYPVGWWFWRTIRSVSLPWPTPLVIGPVCGALAWLKIDAKQMADDLTTFLEEHIRLDLNGDGEIGQPDPNRTLVTVAVEDGHSRRYLNDIPVTPQLKRFLRAFLNDATTFSERGAGLHDVLPADFEVLRDELLGRGMVHWKNEDNHRSGYHWSPVAHRALAELRDVPLPDTV